MDYSRHRRSRKLHSRRRDPCCESSTSTLCDRTSTSSCDHHYREVPCHNKGSGNCCIRRCCKCGHTTVICKCKRGRPGATGPTGPTGPGCPCPPDINCCSFGNGSDGDVDLCLNPNAISNPLDRDYYFNNLKVCLKLRTGGFRIFVKDTLTLDEGIICDDGGDGGPPNGIGAPLGTCGRGTNGGFGVNGHGENSDKPTIGGIGGFGKYAPGQLFPFSPTSGGAVILNFFPDNTRVRDLNGNMIWGGTGGGGDDGLPPGGITLTEGGGGAGNVMIAALNIQGNGTIRARGGNGSPTGKTGGGGGGGIILDFRAKADDANIILDVQGGTGFNGGTNGTQGSIFIVQVGA